MSLVSASTDGHQSQSHTENKTTTKKVCWWWRHEQKKSSWVEWGWFLPCESKTTNFQTWAAASHLCFFILTSYLTTNQVSNHSKEATSRISDEVLNREHCFKRADPQKVAVTVKASQDVFFQSTWHKLLLPTHSCHVFEFSCWVWLPAPSPPSL